jgi:4-hydroxy-tetrahydrodipicolinate reductase
MNLAIIGYGKMGKAIEKIAVAHGHQVVLVTNSLEELKKSFQDAPNLDVAIEFSTPESAFENIKFCLENNLPVLSGTTGWLNRLPEIEEIVKKNSGTFIYASNYSLGVNLFFRLNKYLAKLLSKSNYTVDIEETHHIHKKDAPSGTAITLADDIIAANTELSRWINGQAEKLTDLPITSIREQNVPGTHMVTYQGEHDEISIKHRAHSREGFALGAVTVANWLKDEKGMLTMDDFLDGKL